MRKLILVPISTLIVYLFALTPAYAQTPGAFDVFFSANVVKGKAGLFFSDVRTGLSTIVQLNGTRFSALTDSILFQETDTRLIKVAHPDGRVELYTPMQPSGPDLRIDWAVSTNQKWIVWTTTHQEGQSLIGDMYLLSVNGEKKQILRTSSTSGMLTMPLAVTDDGNTIFYTRQLDPPPDAYVLFPTASDIYQLDASSGKANQLSGEPRCACGAAFSANGQVFLRLEIPPDGNGFNAHVWDLAIKSDRTLAVPALSAANPYTQAGYVLFAAGNRLAAYTAARGTPLTKSAATEKYYIVLVDLERNEQRIVSDVLISALRPVSFSPDRSALLLAGTQKEGTYKLTLKDGTLTQVSAYTYLGSVAG